MFVNSFFQTGKFAEKNLFIFPPQMSKTEKRKFIIDVRKQVQDQLFNPEDMVEYFKDIMKIHKSKKFAREEIEYSVDGGDTVSLESDEKYIKKSYVKASLKRFLRKKSLRSFIRITGDSKNGLSLEYINNIGNEE